MYEQEFQRIIDASRNNSLTFFVGAGVSALSNAPSWKDLIQDICRELNLPIKNEYSSDENLKIPQIYYYSNGKDDTAYYNFIEERLTAKNLLPNDVHKELLNFNPSSFITTNFDELIEEAAIQHCQSFKVVACDDEVSSINGDRYILKLHGDLRHRNIVFKEEDYLNYSEKFKLIETLLKSIFSTNTVVFIGYGLNDYNIKLILNWAKMLLKDHFNKPIFIHTDGIQLSTEELLYQESKGLCVIECEKIAEHTNDFFTRYMTALKAIKKSLDLSLDGKTEQEAFETLYKLLEPLDRLNALRVNDVYYKLSPHIRISDDGTIMDNLSNHILIQYFIRINSASKEEYEAISNADKEKYQIILNVLKKARITHIETNQKRYCFTGEEVIFADPNCISYNYPNMYDFTTKIYYTVHDNYKKAFYLVRLKKYEEAFYLFGQIANQSFKSKDYILYYFAEVNCINLRTMLRSANNRYRCYDIEKIDETAPTEKEIEHLFEKLPLEIQNQYASFKDIHSTSLLYKYSYQAFVDGEKLRNSIESNSMEYGLTSSIRVMCRINEYLHFLIGNGIVVDIFTEFKNTIKNLMSLLVNKYSIQGKKILHEQLFPGSTQNEVFFDEIDFYCFIEIFDDNELKQLFSKHHLETITFKNLYKIENTVINILKYYKQLLKSDATSVEILGLQKQIKVCLVLLRYVDISQFLVNEICRFIFKYESNILINEKIMFLEYQLQRREKYSDITSKIIEDKLLFYIDSHIKAIENSKKFEVFSPTGINYYNLINYITHPKNKYYSRRVAIRISYIIKNNMTEMIPHITNHYCHYISPSSRYKVTIWAKERLSSNFSFDLFKLLVSCKARINREIVGLLEEYLRDSIKKNSVVSSNMDGIIGLDRNTYEELEHVGYWCFIGVLNKDKFKTFEGVSNLFDFYWQYEKFDFTKFDVSWLLTFYPHVLVAITKNKRVKERIRLAIVRILDSGDIADMDKSKLLNILTHYFC